MISNLRRHLRVHRPSNIRRRLTSQERREYVEKLIQKSTAIYEGHANYNTFPSMCYGPTSPSSSSTSSMSSFSSSDYSTPSPSSSPTRCLSPAMEPTNYRLLKPKMTRPLCLTVQHLLNWRKLCSRSRIKSNPKKNQENFDKKIFTKTKNQHNLHYNPFCYIYTYLHMLFSIIISLFASNLLSRSPPSLSLL